MKKLDPIFVHASPRSGSTYFFNVLRRNPELMCFNEAISDVYHIKDKPKFDPRHDFLEKDDLAELKLAWSRGFKPPPYPAFHKYHEVTLELEHYIRGLIQWAWINKRRPAFCEIYSRYRAEMLKQLFGGIHIAQVRDFIPQFGSFMRALIEGGEWGFLALPWLEDGLSGIDAIDRASLQTIESLDHKHIIAWANANEAAMRASNMKLDISNAGDRYKLQNATGLKLDFSDLKIYPQYPIPSDSEWRKIARKSRPTLKIATAKLLSALHLRDKLNQLRRRA